MWYDIDSFEGDGCMNSSALEELYKFYYDSVARERIKKQDVYGLTHKDEKMDYTLWLLRYKKVLEFYKAFLLSLGYKLDDSIIELNKGVSDSLGSAVTNASNFVEPMGMVFSRNDVLSLFVNGVYETFKVDNELNKTVIAHNPYKIVRKQDEDKILTLADQGVKVAYSVYGYDDDMDKDVKIRNARRMSLKLRGDNKIIYKRQDGMYVGHTQNF